jgi:hypothetical protein
LLRFVLADDEGRAAFRRFPYAPADGGEDVLLGRVDYLLRRVEPQPVEMELVNPVAGVGDEELTHRSSVRAVEIDRFAPLVLVAVGEVLLGEALQVISVGAEMVVDHVEDHAETERVCAVDEAAEIVRRAVEPRGREEVDAVVAPAEATGELRDGHQFEHGDAKLGQGRKLARRGVPGALRRECADVQLVEHLTVTLNAAPCHVAPGETRRVNYHRTAVRPVRLKARGGVGQGRILRVEAEAIERSGRDPRN